MATPELLSGPVFRPRHGSRREPQRRASLFGSETALAVAYAAFHLVGCASTELAPSAPNADGTAVARTSSVEVRAQVRPVHPDVPSSLTPIELTVKNLAPGAVSVALEDIELVAADGSAPAILPESIPLRSPMGLGIDPRRRELIDGAFAGGAIDTGRTERGTVYFDTANIEADRVTLRVVVRAGSDRGVAQALEIPFSVQS